MKTAIVAAITSVALVLVLALPGKAASADDLKSLRGDTPIPEESDAPDIYRQLTPEKFERSYKHQPPLITHKISRYDINLKVNECLRCHDKSTYKKEEAPMANKSHYIDDNGKEGDEIIKRRYFCIQCHVPQEDARPLVENTFAGAK
jgi:cytochrome c-type protein NapB